MVTLKTGKEGEVAATAREDVTLVTEVEQESNHDKPVTEAGN